MRLAQRIISIGFATAAIASASLPALSGYIGGSDDEFDGLIATAASTDPFFRSTGAQARIDLAQRAERSIGGQARGDEAVPPTLAAQDFPNRR